MKGLGQTTRSVKAFFILSLLLVPFIFQILRDNGQFISSQEERYESSPTSNIILSDSPADNMSINTKHPRLIWIKGSMRLEIRSNITGQIKYTLTDASGGEYFKIENNGFDLEGNNKKSSCNIDIDPHLMSLPGKYDIFLLVSYVNETQDQYEEVYNMTFDVILGLGDVYISLLLIIFGTATLIILTGRTEIEMDQAQGASQGPTQAQVQTVADAPEGKIKCPHCKEIIEEGLTFCPECGHRIAEFLRYNPNQE
ncbi:MAG: zinc ribbon domain-containing protein [Promethearchaeia archaeon]